MFLNDFIGFLNFIVFSVITVSFELECYVSGEKDEVEATLPWFCSVMDGNYLVSMCTIVQSSYVVVSLDSLNRKIPDSSKYFFQAIDELEIRAGTGHRLQDTPDPNSYQVRKPSQLYTGSVTNLEIDVDLIKNPQTLDNIVLDVYGVGLNIAFLYFDSPFQWSSHVSPAPLPPTPAIVMHEKIKYFSDRLESNPQDQKHCVVAHWVKATGEMVFTEVVYVTKQACQESYCNFDEANCLKFPKREYLMCFKSLKHNDMCPSARGAALYCDWYENSVLAILTTALNCGDRNLPSVYTSVEWVARLFKKINDRDLEPAPAGRNYPYPRS